MTELAELFDAEPLAVGDEALTTARYNLAPTDPAAVVVERADGRRAIAAFRWGLVPHWAPAARIAGRTFNARARRSRRCRRSGMRSAATAAWFPRTASTSGSGGPAGIRRAAARRHGRRS